MQFLENFHCILKLRYFWLWCRIWSSLVAVHFIIGIRWIIGKYVLAYKALVHNFVSSELSFDNQIFELLWHQSSKIYPKYNSKLLSYWQANVFATKNDRMPHMFSTAGLLISEQCRQYISHLFLIQVFNVMVYEIIFSW